MYTFDKVNPPEVKVDQALAWNDEKSKNCIVLMTNDNPETMAIFGYKDLELKKQVTINFQRGQSCRTAYIYQRKSLG